ncbi:MAG: FapA family protein [Candidatus Hinthialibacter antarcticus]|nr:FapA family protein [Candidatus Hinthialibacter antarcticus]
MTEVAPEPTVAPDDETVEKGPLFAMRQLQAELESRCGDLENEDDPPKEAEPLLDSLQLLRQMNDWVDKMPESRIREALISIIKQLEPVLCGEDDSPDASILEGAVRALGVDVEISSDRMTAFLVQPKVLARYWSPETIAEAIAENGVAHGIDAKALETLFNKKLFDRRVKVARGKPPIAGKNAVIEDPLKLLARADIVGKAVGSRIDYKEQTMFRPVQEEDVLLHKIPADPGVAGMDVTGEDIPSTPGLDADFPQNSNCKLSEDGLFLHTAMSGCAYMKDGKLNVVPALNIDGNVDFSSGNVKTPVAVQIKGDVLTDFRVETDGEVAVSGVVEGAVIHAQQSILCNQGIEGKDKARINAGADLKCKYIKNAYVKAEGCINVDGEIIQSEVRAKRIHCEGKDGSIIGGKIFAWDDVCAKVIGSDMGVRTEITLGSELTELEERQHHLAGQLNHKQEQRDKLVEAKSKSGAGAASQVDEELQAEIDKVGQELEALAATLDGCKRDFEASQTSMRTVRAEKDILPGVIVRILGKGIEIKSPTGPATITYSDGKLTTSPYQERELDSDAEEEV